MSQSQSSLRFSLEESVWFKKGQEVDELLSISLDPHITIQEQEQYVQIQGNLLLSGEFKSSSSENVEQELDLHGKFAQRVEYLEEDIFQFLHQFPVDVTIPKTRIENLEAIDVMIDAFDYSLPEKGNLKLNADIAILGIRSEEVDESVDQQIEEDNSSYQVPPLDIDHLEEEESSEVLLFEAETNDKLESVQRDSELVRATLNEEEEDSPHEQEDELFEPFTIEVRKKSDEEQNEEEVEVPINIGHEENSQTPTLQFGVNDQEVEAESEEKFALSRFSEEESPSQVEVETNVESSPVLEHEDVEVVEEEEEEVPVKKKKKFGKYESISLADFFARKSEEKAAKLKVCIVQHGESLDRLAEKYDISVQQILRMNHLEMNQDVYEGQVLYIPSYASATKGE